MFRNNKYLVSFGLVVLVNLTSSLKVYLIKDELLSTKANGNHQRQPNLKISKQILPLKDLVRHVAVSKANGRDYNLPHDKYDCMPGKICITKTRHKEDKIIINDALRHGRTRPFDSSEYQDSSSDTREFADSSDDVEFRDLTRLQETLNHIQAHKDFRRSSSSSISDNLDADDVLRTAKNTVSFDDFNPNPKTILRKLAYRKTNRRHRNLNLLVKRRAGSDDYDDSESDSNSSNSDSESEEKPKKNIKKKKRDDREGAFDRVPKRFEVVKSGKKFKYKNYALSNKYSQSEELPIQKVLPLKKKAKKHKEEKVEKVARDKKEMYIQGPGRSIKVGRWSSDEDSTFRRRLPHFLPKRYHWDEDDFKHLGFYWFHGPQGRFPGIYKIGY